MIVIVGAGALGSHVALFGRNWEQKIRIVDFDKVEMKNTQAQFHTKMALRRNKAHSLGQAFHGLFGLRIDAVPHKLVKANAAELLGGADLVIDCTDNIEARNTIMDFVRAAKIPCLHGALSGDGSFARIVWDEHFEPDAEGSEGEATCEDGETLPFFAMAAAVLAEAAQEFLATGRRRCYHLSPTGMVRLA